MPARILVVDDEAAIRRLLRRHEGCGLGAGFVFEIDVEALVRQFARGDVGEGALGLKRAQNPVIVFGVLLVVLGQHPVAAGRRVTGQLLIALINGLGVAADLDVFGPLRIPRTIRIGVVGVIGARLVPIASALTLHALEISHSRYRVQGWSQAVGPGPSVSWFRFARGRSPIVDLSECLVARMVRRPCGDRPSWPAQAANSRAKTRKAAFEWETRET